MEYSRKVLPTPSDPFPIPHTRLDRLTLSFIHRKIHEWVKEHGGGTIIPFSGSFEFELQVTPDDQKKQFQVDQVRVAFPKSRLPVLPIVQSNYSLTLRKTDTLFYWYQEMQTVLPKIVKTAFAMIHLIYFFTAGSDEVKAWCIRKGYKAPQAAGAIHTDFERGFICAETMGFEDLKELGSEAECKAKGKYKQEGKTYGLARFPNHRFPVCPKLVTVVHTSRYTRLTLFLETTAGTWCTTATSSFSNSTSPPRRKSKRRVWGYEDG